MAILLKQLKRPLFALLTAGGLILGMPGAALAFGFGALSVESHLGEPLRAEIRLQTVDRQERDSLSVRLVSRAEYTRFGIEYPPLADLSLELAGDGADTHLRVTSVTPLNRPYLNLLLRAEWANGEAVRQYTLLMTAREAESDAETAFEPTPPQVPVRSGDTLSKIVQRLQLPQSVSLEQALVALFVANPGAFIDGNMNWVPAGAVLGIPSVDEISAVQLQAARQTVRVQYQAWLQQVGQLPAGAEGSGTRLTLSAAEFSNLQNRTETRESSLQVANDANEELVQHLEQLEAELTQTQGELDQDDRALPSEDRSSDSAVIPLKTADEVPESSTASEAPPAASTETSDAEPADAPSSPPADPAPETPAPRTEAEPAAGLDDLLATGRRGLEKLIGIAGRYGVEAVIGLLLVLLVLYLWLQRRLSRSGRARNRYPSGAARRNLWLGTPGDSAAADTGGLDAKTTNTLTKADTLMSRGRLEKARKLLESAWRNQPETHDLAVKLLEVYRRLDESQAFVSVIDRLSEIMPETDPRWLEVDRIMQEAKQAKDAADATQPSGAEAKTDSPPMKPLSEPALAAKPPAQPPARPPVQSPAQLTAKPSAQAPAKPPAQPPAKPPAQAPARPPAKPPAQPPAPKVDENPALKLMQLENYVKERNLPAFETLAQTLLSNTALPNHADIADHITKLRAKLDKPEMPPFEAAPKKTNPAAASAGAPPKPVPAKPKAAPAKVASAGAAPKPAAPAAEPAKAQSESGRAVPSLAKTPSGPDAASRRAEAATKLVRSAPKPAKPAAGANSTVDLSSYAVPGTNALAMAKIYMDMEEMDIAKQFLLQASKEGPTEQREEAAELLKWWDN